MLTGLAVAGCSKSQAPEQAAPPAKSALSEEEQARVQDINAKALQDVEPLAYQGDAASQRKLGVMYYLGQGVTQDYAVASDWLGKSAEQGDVIAQMMLGTMYAEGEGVPQDRVRAHTWFSLSAEQGNASARDRIGALVSQMSTDQIASAEQAAREWKARHPS